MIPKALRGAGSAYLGGERTGCKPGRGAAGKTPFVAAVETTDQHSPVRLKLTKIKGFKSAEIQSWSEQHLTRGSIVISDGLACFNAVVDAGCVHDKIVCGGGRASVEEPEFAYRFNRRFDLAGMIPRLAYAALRTVPMPEKLLKISLG